MFVLKRRWLWLVWFVALPALAKEVNLATEKDAPVIWKEKATPGPAVLLRLKRNLGKCLIYEGSLHRSQKSANSCDENDSFYLNILCADSKDALDLVAIQRSYIDRKRVEFLENGKKIDRILENSSDLIDLGPNFEIVGQLRCYAFDAQNRVAYRTEQLLTLKDGRQLRGKILEEDATKIVFLALEEKIEVPRAEVVSLSPLTVPHILLNETPHYFFPILSQKKVAPGDTWKFKVPVIIPIEQGNPPKVLPTHFTVNMIGRLREARDNIATVDYQTQGSFDSAAPEFADRFPEAFQSLHRITHKFVSDGVITLDIDKGRILSKNESFQLTLYARSIVPQDLNKDAKKEEMRAEINAQFEIKLLAPGTRLKSNAVIPDYD